MKIIRKRLLSLRFKSGMLVIVLLFLSCDTTIDPLERETGTYAIYGVLDLNDSTNYIRVRDLNVPFTAEATETIDANVQLELLNAAQSYTLDSEREDIEGVYEFNFLHDQPIRPDETYQLKVERSDGLQLSLSTITPTKPIPEVSPFNQNCYTQINFKLGPLNKGVIVMKFGFPNDTLYTSYIWGNPIVYESADSDSNQTLEFSFTPYGQVNDILRGSNRDRKCFDHLRTSELFLSYIHYGPSFYEEIFETEFDIQRTQRFGSLYYDTLAIPVDTTPVCPQDCE